MAVVKHHPIVRGVALGLAYGVAAPIIKGLELLDRDYSTWLGLMKRGFTSKTLNAYFEDYTPTNRDIFVCTYPKSGTNWTLQIIYQLLHKGDGDFGYIHDVVAWPDGEALIPVVSIDDESVYAPDNGMRLIKSHLPMGYVPYNTDAKYIFILRDPKDTFVSSYHFFKDVTYGPLMPRFDTYLKLFLSDIPLIGHVAQHMDSYWQLRDADNVLVLTFGEMKVDLAGTIQRIADFIGVALDDTIFERVQEKASFNYMKSIDHKFFPGAVTPFAPGKGNMIRKGKRGNSSELLTPEQQQLIDDTIRADLKRLGSDLPYNALFEVI